MKELTPAQRQLCDFQGNIFSVSVDASPCGSAAFVRRFMRSSLAKRMDLGEAALGTEPEDELVRMVDLEYDSRFYGSKHFSKNELYWMGYLYRYWACAAGMSSRWVYKQVGAQ